MNGFLLDTNVISEMVSVRPDPRVVHWIGAADESELYLSVTTLGEIRQGVAALPQKQEEHRLETWLELDLRLRFTDASWRVTEPWRIGGDGIMSARIARKLSVQNDQSIH